MSDPYTPTTKEVRRVYVLAPDNLAADGKPEWSMYTQDQFDRWLAAHDAEVRADERERCAQIVREERDRLEVVKGTYAQGQRHVLGVVWAAIRAVSSDPKGN